MQKITPFLWFDNNAEEAMNFYTSVFKNSRIVSINRYPEGMAEEPMKNMTGKVLTGVFELEGQQFMCLDGGPIFKFNESVSMYYSCDTQAELDEIWDKLSAHPESEQCGWLKDKYGLSWQIIPSLFEAMMKDSDQAKTARVMKEVLQMKKLDIAKIEAAANGN